MFDVNKMKIVNTTKGESEMLQEATKQGINRFNNVFGISKRGETGADQEENAPQAEKSAAEKIYGYNAMPAHPAPTERILENSAAPGTAKSPAELIYGHKVMPSHGLNGSARPPKPPEYPDYTSKLPEVLKKAEGWLNTDYALEGTKYSGSKAEKKSGADCSGAVWGIYKEGGLDYPYEPTSGFDESMYFRKLENGERGLPGDVVVVRGSRNGQPSGHAGIYDPNLQPPYNILSAEKKGFKIGTISVFESQHKGKANFYRYVGPPKK